MALVSVNIGSNLGDRRLNISRAVRAISMEFGDFEISHVVESAPWGFDSTHSFLNVGLTFETDLNPEETLRRLQNIEKGISGKSHRTASGGYTDREIDIDVITFDSEVIDLPHLQVPHPRMPQRSFVLQPLAELMSWWRHPLTGLTPFEMLENLDK